MIEVIDVDPDRVFGSILPTAEPIVVLAMAVIRRATQDLTVAAKHLGPDIQRIRWDAYEFLLETLWEPSCIWGQILGNAISKERIKEVVLNKVIVSGKSIYTKKEYNEV